MKKLNITKEQFEKSKYFNDKYGKLEYVSESGKMFKTSKGKLLKFKESSNTKDEPYSVYKFINTLRWDYNEYMLEEPKELEETGDGWKQISIMCSKSQYRKMLGVVKEYCQKYGWEYDSHRIDEDVFEIVVSQWDESTLTDDYRESTKKFGKKFAKESIDSEVNAVRKTMEKELNSMADRLKEFKHLAIEKLNDKKLAKDLEDIENQVAEVYYDV